jgi:hypothetical protein
MDRNIYTLSDFSVSGFCMHSPLLQHLAHNTNEGFLLLFFFLQFSAGMFAAVFFFFICKAFLLSFMAEKISHVQI